jgi:hypothetical protein
MKTTKSITAADPAARERNEAASVAENAALAPCAAQGTKGAAKGAVRVGSAMAVVTVVTVVTVAAAAKGAAAGAGCSRAANCVW